MTCDDIISMAREAGWHDDLLGVSFTAPLLARFAALVSAEKEQQMIRDGWRKCAEGQRTTQYCGLLEEAVEAEREACAKVCDEKYEAVPKNDPYAEADGDYSDLIYAGAAQDCAEAIRARGET